MNNSKNVPLLLVVVEKMEIVYNFMMTCSSKGKDQLIISQNADLLTETKKVGKYFPILMFSQSFLKL